MTDTGKVGRRRISRRAILAAAGVVVVSPFAAAAWGYDPDWLVVRRYAVSVPRLDRVTRVVQVSDLHADQDGSCSPELREQVAEAVRRESPDWVFATGDYITRPGDSIEEATSWVAGLDAREGVFAVMGNHDSPPVKAVLVGKGVTVLSNAWTRVSGIAVAGVGDLSRWPHEPQKVLRTVPPGVGIVLLAHQPDSFWSYDVPVTLQLSGHTHGGQATLLGTIPAPRIIPLLKPLLMEVPALEPVARQSFLETRRGAWAGFFDRPDGSRLYVNRGLGRFKRLSFYCPPELTVWELTPA
jgi:predicted MPP superfamily phosphohydrolase